MNYKLLFSDKSIKRIKEEIKNNNEEDIVYLNMNFFKYTSNLVGILICFSMMFLFEEKIYIGLILGLVIYFVLLVGITFIKRKFFIKNKDKLTDYVKERIKNLNN